MEIKVKVSNLPESVYDSLHSAFEEGVDGYVTIEVHYEPEVPAKLTGHPDTWCDEEPEVFEVEYIECQNGFIMSPSIEMEKDLRDICGEILEEEL